MSHSSDPAQAAGDDRYFRHLVECAADAVLVLDSRGQLRYCSERGRDWLGYDDAELAALTVRHWDADIDGTEWERIVAMLGPEPAYLERRHRRKDGTICRTGVTAVRVDHRGEGLVYAAVRDITALALSQQQIAEQAQALALQRDEIAAQRRELAQRQQQILQQQESLQRQGAALQAQRDELHTIMDLLPVGVALINSAGLIGRCNPCLAALAGGEAGALEGRPLPSLFHAGERPRVTDAIVRCAAGEALPGQDLCGADGTRLFSVALRRLDSGFSLAATVLDVTAERAHLRALQEQATTDTLTGLGNRRALAAQYAALQYSCERYGRAFSLLLLDLDGYEALIEGHGRDSGERLLREFAATAAGSLRRGDGLYRGTGAQFVALLPETPQDAALGAAEKLRRAVAAALEVAGQGLTVSVGGADGTRADSLEGLLQWADRGLCAARDAGGNRVVFTDQAARSPAATGRRADGTAWR